MKKLASIIISVVILGLLYQFLDREALFKALRQTDLQLLSLSLVFLVILVLLSGLRLFYLGTCSGLHMSPAKAVEATFAANALNIFLPGKLGDILKATLLVEGDTKRLRSAITLTVWEKLSDLAMLFLVATISFSFAAGNANGVLLMGFLTAFCLGVLISPKLTSALGYAFSKSILHKSLTIRELLDAWLLLQKKLIAGRLSLLSLLGLSFIFCAGHILQICLMIRALGISADFVMWANIVSLIPIAIVAGLIPLTFAGIGTRDAALVLLLGGFIGKEAAAALGILFWLRYLVPGILGVPLLPKFMRVTMTHVAERKSRGAK